MTAIISTPDFARAARLHTLRLRYRKVLAVLLFLIALFGARAYADEKSSTMLSFSSLKSESVLGFYFFDFKTLRPAAPSTSGDSTFLHWNPELALSVVRPFESLPLELFHHHSTRFSRFEPGLGTYFPNDNVGRSKTSGAGLEENRWIYVKLKFRF